MQNIQLTNNTIKKSLIEVLRVVQITKLLKMCVYVLHKQSLSKKGDKKINKPEMVMCSKTN